MSTERAEIQNTIKNGNRIDINSFSGGDKGRCIQLTQRSIPMKDDAEPHEAIIRGMFDTIQLDEQAVKELITELQAWVFEK